MSELPPIIPPQVVPPPLPVLNDVRPRYLYRCKVICIVAGSLFLVGIAGGIMKCVSGESVEIGVFIFAGGYVVIAYGAAAMLHRRRASGYVFAILTMIVMLLLFPLGTLFGILGMIWLNRAKGLLQ